MMAKKLFVLLIVLLMKNPIKKIQISNIIVRVILNLKPQVLNN